MHCVLHSAYQLQQLYHDIKTTDKNIILIFYNVLMKIPVSYSFSLFVLDDVV